eukprot:COSAG01_NODE_759_length_13802_cov_16.155221_4_plen_57_part_00
MAAGARGRAAWVILDDRDIKASGHDGMERRFVRTKITDGLTDADVERALRVLADHL